MTHGDTREYFDRIATSFSANYRNGGNFGERFRVLNRLISDSIACLEDGSLFLDVGCGDGVLSRTVAARGFKTIGIDQSTSMLSLARDSAAAGGIATNVEYCEAAIPMAPPLLDRFKNAVGLILCSSVLEYVDDYRAALRQFDEMLVGGGRVIVSVPNRYSLYRRVERWLKPFLSNGQSYLKYQRHQFCADALKTMFIDMGFTIAHEEYFALPLHDATARALGDYRGK